MNPVFAKLNYKAQSEITVINMPAEFASAVESMQSLAIIVTNPQQIQEGSFIIAFVKTQQEVNTLVPVLTEKLQGDGLLWFAYPKGSSKKYTCDFNRDTGWAQLGELGFESVRMIAIDEDWSAVRFRRTQYIKKMTRQDNRAMSQQGKEKLLNP